MAEKYQEHQEQARNDKINNLVERISLIQDTFRIVVVDSKQSSYDQFHNALDAYDKIVKLVNGKDSIKTRKEIDRQLLIGRISLDKVDVFLRSQSERMNALQEEENRARTEGRVAKTFVNDLGKYKKIVGIEYEKPHEYFSSGGVETTPHMKVKFPDIWYKEKSQAASRLITLLGRKAVVLNGFKGLANVDVWTEVHNALYDIATMKHPGHKAFLKIAAEYDEDTIYGSEGALNIILGMQRTLGGSNDEAFDYLCSPGTDNRKKENKVEIYLITEGAPQVQPAPAKLEPKQETKPFVRPAQEVIEPEPAPKATPKSRREVIDEEF